MSDRGKVLSSLDSKTLYGVSGWLDEHVTEALERDEHSRYAELCFIVRSFAWLGALPPDDSLFSEQHDDTLPFQLVGYYKSSGRRKDLTKIIQLERLRKAPHRYSERDMEAILDVPRTTLRDMIGRMEEIGFSLDEFSPDDLAYVAFGSQRGRKRAPESF